MIRERILFRLFFSLLPLLSFSPFCTYEPTFQIPPNTLEETCGYYGEKIVLYAQTLGLNTCWVAMTYSKGKAVFQLDPGEKLCLVIAVGYGQTQGVSHKVKAREAVMKVQGTPPDWFIRGIDAALLAPTAMNQQKFTFSLDGSNVTAKAGIGFYSKIDLGIAKYHFELGAGAENFNWNVSAP